jgi:hypothetical protein
MRDGLRRIREFWENFDVISTMEKFIGFSDLSTETAQELCARWQTVLRLSDWDIRVSVLPLTQLSCPNSLGYIVWNTHEKIANIELMSVEDAIAINEFKRPYNIEETLIHELIHLHLAAWDTSNDLEQTQMEFAINAIAAALYKLKSADTVNAPSEAGDSAKTVTLRAKTSTRSKIKK